MDFSKNKIKPMVLLVLDGFGAAPASDGNAITLADTPNLDRYSSVYPYGQLIASGESVGLPANEVGNSEVGHLTIGAGRVINQSLKKINNSIEDESFYENEAFFQAVNHVKTLNTKLHIMGLVSTGSVHSSIKHFYSLVEYCVQKELTNVSFHLFTDGRDASPTNGAKVIQEIEARLKETRVGRIASVSGRYYAMDRDARWERTQKAYEAIVMGKGLTANSAVEAVKASYARNETDEFIKPTVILSRGRRSSVVDNNDAVIFFNFRVDRARQLTMAFVSGEFEKLKSFEISDKMHHGRAGGKIVKAKTFKREKWPSDVFFVTMTRYQRDLHVSAVAYPPEAATDSLPETLARNNLKQLHLTESEKEKMVTFYFNGAQEVNFPGEEVLIVPSKRKVATYDKKPEMSVYDVVKEFKKAISKDKFNFVIMNFANSDMVAHSGELKATIKAVEHVDKAVAEVVETTLAVRGTVVITADHGNAEELIKYPTGTFYYTTSKGEINTDHSNNPVPLYIIRSDLEGKGIKLGKGALSDVAPTVLSMMELKIPTVMTGNNLLQITEERKDNGRVAGRE